MAQFDDPYGVLGVESSATDSEIKKAYLALVRTHSPESDPEKFQAISAAYQLLSNPEKRRQYDEAPALSKELTEALENRKPSETAEEELAFLENLRQRMPHETIIEQWIAMLKLDLGRAGDVVHVFEKMMREKPSEMRLRRCYARSLIHAGKTAEGFAFLEATCELDPKDALSWFWLSMERELVGEIDGALEAVEIGIEKYGHGDAQDLFLVFRKLHVAVRHRQWAAAHAVKEKLIALAERSDAETKQHIVDAVGNHYNDALKEDRIDSAGVLIDIMTTIDPSNEEVKKIAADVVPRSIVVRQAAAIKADGEVRKEIRDFIVEWMRPVESEADRQKRNEAIGRIADRLDTHHAPLARSFAAAKKKYPELIGAVEEDWNSLVDFVKKHRRERIDTARRAARGGGQSGFRAIPMWIWVLLAVVISKFLTRVLLK